MMTYSIIIPVYKAEKYLTECIESVLAQDSPSSYEVILVDDGSPDGSGAICDDYAAKHENIRVIHQPNQGVSVARNTGIDAAQGEYILFLDSDDLWAPELLSTVDPFLTKAPDMVQFGHQMFNDTRDRISPVLGSYLPHGESGKQYLKTMLDHDVFPPTTIWGFAIKRDLLSEIRFDKDLICSEDFDFIMQCFEITKTVYSTDKMLYWYRVNGVSNRPYRPEILMCDLRMKAYWYRRYPCAAMANTFVYIGCLISMYSTRSTCHELVAFFKKNQDIWNDVSGVSMHFAVWLFRLLGCYNGSVIFQFFKTHYKASKR